MRNIEAENVAIVELYLTWFRDTKGNEAASTYDYASRLGQFLKFIGRTPLGSATVEQMESFINRPRRGGKPMGAASTRSKEASILHSCYGWAAARGHIPFDPSLALEGPEVHNKHPKPIAKEHWAAWWAAPLNDDQRVVTGLGFYVGLRREEIVNLAPSHVSQLTRKLVGFPRKGGGDDVTPYGDMVDVLYGYDPMLFGPEGPDSFLRPLHDMAAGRLGKPRLLDWRETSGRPCATNQAKHQLGVDDIDPERVNSRLKSWQRTLGVARFNSHQQRHSTATYLVDAGVPLHIVKELMNHSSFNTTLRYVKIGGSALGDWAKQQQRTSAADEGKPTTLSLGKYNRFA